MLLTKNNKEFDNIPDLCNFLNEKVSYSVEEAFKSLPRRFIRISLKEIRIALYDLGPELSEGLFNKFITKFNKKVHYNEEIEQGNDNFQIDINIVHAYSDKTTKLTKAIIHECTHALDKYAFTENTSTFLLDNIRSEGLSMFAEIISNPEVFFDTKIKLKFKNDDFYPMNNIYEMNNRSFGPEEDVFPYKIGFAMVLDIFLNIIGRGKDTKKFLINLYSDNNELIELIKESQLPTGAELRGMSL